MTSSRSNQAPTGNELPIETSPVSFDLFDENSKELNNCLVTGLNPVDCTIEDIHFQLNLFAFLPGNHIETKQKSWIKLSAEGKIIWLYFDQWPDELLNSNKTISPLLTSDSINIRKMATEVLLGPILDWFESKSDLKITVVDIERDKFHHNLPLILSFTFKNKDETTFSGRIMLPEALRGTMYTLLSHRQKLPERDMDHLELSSPLCIGSTSITVDGLNDLEAGDVILLENDLYSEHQNMLVQFIPGISVILKKEKNNLMVENITQETTPENRSDEQIKIKAALNPFLGQENNKNDINSEKIIDNLDVKLDFNLGSISLPLKQIKQLQPGYIFSLDKPLEKTVNITCNDQTIAEGDLVEVNGRIGIKLLSFKR